MARSHVLSLALLALVATTATAREGSPVDPGTFMSQRTREAVQAEAALAVRAGTIAYGELGRVSTLPGPASMLSRENVRSQILAGTSRVDASRGPSTF